MLIVLLRLGVLLMEGVINTPMSYFLNPSDSEFW
jgi:hypothetical protein